MSWRETTVGEFVTIKHGFAFKSKDFSDTGSHIVLTPGNCHNEGGFKSKGDKEKWFIGEVPADYLLSKGDLIVVMTDLVQSAPVLGGSFKIPEDDKFLHNQRLGLIHVKENAEVHPDFLYHLFNTHGYRGQVRGSASGATVRHTSPGRILDCQVSVPDLPTQERIAGVLSAYDDLIETNRQRIALLEQAARLLYREWFVHFRFPGHETTKFSDGLPVGWTRSKLGDVCATNKQSYKKGKLPKLVRYVDIGSVTTGQINEVTEYEADAAPGRARRIAEPFDTIWSNVRPNLKAYALVTSPRENDVFSTGFTVLHAESVSPFFLYFCVTTDDFVQHLVNHSTGASYPAVRADDFERAEVLCPKTDLMDEFHAKCEPIFHQREKLQEQNRKLAQARDLLLPRLMDGRIYVSG